jgi:hypothetical protein
MIGVLRIACVLALIWAAEENSECGYRHVDSPPFSRGAGMATGRGYCKSQGGSSGDRGLGIPRAAGRRRSITRVTSRR